MMVIAQRGEKGNPMPIKIGDGGDMGPRRVAVSASSAGF
jgi:hypothetical protein